MSNRVTDSFKRWMPQMSPSLCRVVDRVPTYLVPQPSASVIQAYARQHAISLEALTESLVVDDGGAVLLYDIVAESGVVESASGYAVGRPKDAPLHRADPVSIARFEYRMQARFVVFQDYSQTGEIDCIWSEGLCRFGEPQLTSQGWQTMLDVQCRTEDVRMSLTREKRIVTAAELSRAEAHAEAAAHSSISLDVGTAIGTALEQLDHIRRGCSVRPVSRGWLVLTE